MILFLAILVPIGTQACDIYFSSLYILLFKSYSIGNLSKEIFTFLYILVWRIYAT
jgi:hypothetical protein